jgi:hypothetical protein
MKSVCLYERNMERQGRSGSFHRFTANNEVRKPLVAKLPFQVGRVEAISQMSVFPGKAPKGDQNGGESGGK